MLSGVQNTLQRCLQTTGEVYVSSQLIVWHFHITLRCEATLIWTELEVTVF